MKKDNVKTINSDQLRKSKIGLGVGLSIIILAVIVGSLYSVLNQPTDTGDNGNGDPPPPPPPPPLRYSFLLLRYEIYGEGTTYTKTLGSDYFTLNFVDWLGKDLIYVDIYMDVEFDPCLYRFEYMVTGDEGILMKAQTVYGDVSPLYSSSTMYFNQWYKITGTCDTQNTVKIERIRIAFSVASSPNFRSLTLNMKIVEI